MKSFAWNFNNFYQVFMIPVKNWKKERKLSLVYFWKLAFLVPEKYAIFGGQKAKTVKKMSGFKIIQTYVDGP